MRRRPRRWLLALLAAWSFGPVALLLLRTSARAWRYPDLLPRAEDVGLLLSSGAARRLTLSVATSIVLALCTGVVGSALGLAIARTLTRAGAPVRRAAMAAALLPVIAPPIAVGVGVQVVMLNVGLVGTEAGVLLAHLVPATGYLTLFALGVFSSFDFAICDEARTLGASSWQVMTRVMLPLLRPRIAESIVLGALVSWGQLTLTLLIGGGVVRTVPLELLSFVQSGNDQLGALAALVLTIPPMLLIGVLQVGTRRTGAAL